MSTFTLRNFAHVDVLKKVDRGYLVRLLARHEAYFGARGLVLPNGDGMRVDYDKIVSILMLPDEATPSTLVDDLYYVDEMSTTEAMDLLLEAIEKMPPEDQARLELPDGPTPADVAVKVRVEAPKLLEEKHAEYYARDMTQARRSFEYYVSRDDADRTYRRPGEAQMILLKAALNERLLKMKRGTDAEVYIFPNGVEFWFVVKHGTTCKREGTHGHRDASSVYYRPEVYDVMKYDPVLGELCVNAETPKLYVLYRTMIGKYFFGDSTFFPGNGKYTLEPLRTDGENSLLCRDVFGMEWVRLKEIQYLWGGGENAEIEIRKATDLFALWKQREKGIPAKARMLGAKFEVKFRDSNTTRTVSVWPSNRASYSRNSDAPIVEQWLEKRGFVKTASRRPVVNG